MVSCWGQHLIECEPASLTKICTSPSSGFAYCALVRQFCFVEHVDISYYKYIFALRTAASCAAVAVNFAGSISDLIVYGMTHQIGTDADETREAPKFQRKKYLAHATMLSHKSSLKL